MRPGAALLRVQVPVIVDDGLDLEQAVGTDLLQPVGHARQETVALDAAIDDDVCDVNALRAEFAGHGLNHQAQAALRRIERRELRPAAQRA